MPEHKDCHPHHWKIDTPDGPEVPGRCKHCGFERVFSSYGTADWEKPRLARKEHRQPVGAPWRDDA